MATIRDVARECGVSVTTVSFVPNNSPRPVSPETRRRVTEIARRMNYYPNAMARGLVQRRMNSIGVLFAQVDPLIITNNFAAGILKGVFAEAVTRGYDIHLYTRKWESADVSAPRFRNNQTDGTLIVTPTIGGDMVSGLHHMGVPLVVVSSPTAIAGVSFVDVDNTHGARLAAEHLLSLGHTRIAHLMGEFIQHWVFERRDAFAAALARAGHPLRPEYLAGNSFQKEDAEQAVHKLLSLPDPPTAIFAANDDLALCVLNVAQSRGVRVPHDLSVIGFDDYPVSAQTAPPLTTIYHPLMQVGSRAAQLLLSRIENGAVEDVRERLTPSLVTRQSTAPPSF